MHREQIAASTPGILENVVHSPQVVSAAQAYFDALYYSLEELTDVCVDARESTLELFEHELRDAFASAANGAFRDFWEARRRRCVKVDRPSSDSRVSPDHQVVRGRLKSVSRSDAGFVVHVVEGDARPVREHGFFVPNAPEVVERLLSLLDQEVLVEFDPTVRTPEASPQAYTISLSH
jgi:hypothetical protein